MMGAVQEELMDGGAGIFRVSLGRLACCGLRRTGPIPIDFFLALLGFYWHLLMGSKVFFFDRVV